MNQNSKLITKLTLLAHRPSEGRGDQLRVHDYVQTIWKIKNFTAPQMGVDEGAAAMVV